MSANLQNDILEIDADRPGATDLAAKYGIRIGRACPQSKILIHQGSTRPRRITVEFCEQGNTLELAHDDHLFGHIQFFRGGNTFISKGSPNSTDPVKVDCRMVSTNGRVVWGRGSTANGVHIVTAGNGTAVEIGRDCMFSQQIWIRNSDMHGIFDLETGEVINPSADVTIGDHVWVGQESIVLKGAKIGSGSVVGAKSLVSGEFPGGSMIAGVPARTLRRGISWSRSLAPDADEMLSVRRMLGGE